MNREIIEKINECLQKIKDIDQKRCDEASKKGEVYNVSITHWAIVAQSLLPLEELNN